MIVTMLSLGVAAVSGLMAWRVLRMERLRSTARVLSLESAINRDGVSNGGVDHRGFDDDAVGDFEWETPAMELPLREPSDSIIEDDSPQQRSRRHCTLLTAAGCLVAGVVVIVLMAMFADRSDRTPATADAGATQTLELLSMTHAREGGALIVSGLVHNAAHAETAPITTTVTALDRDGQIVARGSTSLAAVGPGKTLPFTVRIDHAGPLGRYRISFRTPAGVLPHVDRRSTPVSRNTVAE
jgi:hypothetical protein